MKQYDKYKFNFKIFKTQVKVYYVVINVSDLSYELQIIIIKVEQLL